jgi:hypothetical protein
MSIIIATWKAEIKRIVAQCQHRQKVYKTPSQPMAKCSSLPVIPTMREDEIRRILVAVASLAKK